MKSLFNPIAIVTVTLILILIGCILHAGLSVFAANAETEPTTDTESSTDTEETTEAAPEPTGSMEVSGSTITVSAADGGDITKALNKALQTARDQADSTGEIITVQVQKGHYFLTKSLHIFSNTTLDVQDVTLTFAGKRHFNLLLSGTTGSYKGYDDYNESEACSGYNGFENITVLGGTWESTADNTSCIVRLFHAKNITLDGLTMTGGASVHQLEVAAIDGFYVKNCTFKNHGKATDDLTNYEKEEAIQLDMPYSEIVYPGTYPDGTPMKNVEITNNTFKNVARGVGTHTMLCGAYHENIKINNNTFVGVLEECIICLNYVGCEVKDNTITNCGGGILIQNAKEYIVSMNTSVLNGAKQVEPTLITELNTEVSGNTIKLKYHSTTLKTVGIFVYGRKLDSSMTGYDGYALPDENFYAGSVIIKNNSIITCGDGITLTDAKNCEVSGNTISGYKFSKNDSKHDERDGIRLDGACSDISITGNAIKNMSRSGITITERSSVSGIENNTIKNCNAAGIYVTESSSCDYDIANNTIRKCTDTGILIEANSKTANITGNQISGIYGDAAIMLCGNSSTGQIASNLIYDLNTDSSGSYCTGILLTGRAAAGDISANRINTSENTISAGTAILVDGAARVSGSITANIISNTADYAISIAHGAKVMSLIRKNTITNSGKSAVALTGTGTKAAGIESNTIDKSETNGILLQENATVTDSITGNTISGCNNYGINIQSMANNLLVSHNQITAGEKAAINISVRSNYLLTIFENTLQGSGKQPGIKLAKCYVAAAQNDLQNFSYGISASSSVSGVICDNIYNSIVNKNLYINKKERKSCGEISGLICSENEDGELTISWDNASSLSGYELQFSTSSDFSEKSIRQLSKDQTSFSLYGYEHGQTIYYRIRTYKTIGSLYIYGSYSEGMFTKES